MMRTVLFSLPPSPDGLHGGRAWRMATELQKWCSVVLTTTGQFDLAGIDAAFVTNSQEDSVTVRRLHDAGIPTLYYPSLGPAVSGFLADGELHRSWHRLETARKMQQAHLVLVDSYAQAEAAASHYGLVCRWLVTPGGGRPVFRELRDKGRLYVMGEAEPHEESLREWCCDKYLDYAPVGDTDAIMMGLDSEKDTVLWLPRVWHPDGLLTLRENGVATVCQDSGVLDATAHFALLPEGATTRQVLAALHQAKPGKKEEGDLWQQWAAAVLRGFALAAPGGK